MDIPVWLWVATVGITLTVLAFDVVVIGRRPHEPTTREVAVALAVYVALALAFGAGVWLLAGHDYGTQFLAGWLTEYSLSVDNLFVFIIVMSRMAVPRQYEQSALMVGIVLALVMRGVFIALGATAISAFSWVFYLFGAFLVYTAVKLARQAGSGDQGYHEPKAVAWASRRVPMTQAYHGAKLWVRKGAADGTPSGLLPSERSVPREGARRLATPMLLVMVALGTTDLLFALDSIPAIYGLTQEPYLVLTANIFALMGLRQLYFLLGDLLERLVYLSYGLAVLLGFIGVKLVLHALHDNSLPFLNSGRPFEWAPDIPVTISLGVIVGTLLLTTVASLVASRGDRPSPGGGTPVSRGGTRQAA